MDDDHRELVRRLWSANIATYSRALQTFCHEALGLSLVVAWRAEPGAAGTGTTTQHLIAELSAIHRDDGASPKLRVASATVQSRDGRATLTEFKTITPHTGMGLREPLCRALEERHEIWQGEPTFSLDKHTPDSKLTVDALKRCHFRPGL